MLILGKECQRCVEILFRTSKKPFSSSCGLFFKVQVGIYILLIPLNQIDGTITKCCSLFEGKRTAGVYFQGILSCIDLPSCSGCKKYHRCINVKFKYRFSIFCIAYAKQYITMCILYKITKHVCIIYLLQKMSTIQIYLAWKSIIFVSS